MVFALKCPSADEWIRKLWYIYTVEYYSAVKNNTFESVLLRWMKLEPIIQSEVSQKEKHIHMEFRKMAMMTLYARQQKRQRCVEQTFGLRRRGTHQRVHGSSTDVLCIISYKKQTTSPGSMQDTGCLGLVHWDDPEG